MKKVAVSGYFTVLHKGHVELFKEAKKLGDELIVIVNNNNQQIGKKGKLIHDAHDIKHIIEHLNMVNSVVISVDKDKTVCKTLEMLNPHIFANGGDRTRDNIPEVQTCKDKGIEMIFNVGGNKHNSSSDILKRGSS